MVTCPDCGKEVPNAKFCRNCGAKLPEVEEVEVVENDAVVDSTEEVIDVGVEEEETADDSAKVIEVVEEETADDSAKVIEVVEEETVEEPAEEVEVNTSSKQTKFCSNCGKEVSVETAFCPKCGYRLIQEEEPQTKFCQSCGKKININAEICPHCGVRVANIRSSEEKSVVLSAILSFLFPGLGHLYIGLYQQFL